MIQRSVVLGSPSWKPAKQPFPKSSTPCQQVLPHKPIISYFHILRHRGNNNILSTVRGAHMTAYLPADARHGFARFFPLRRGFYLPASAAVLNVMGLTAWIRASVTVHAAGNIPLDSASLGPALAKWTARNCLHGALATALIGSRLCTGTLLEEEVMKWRFWWYL